MHLILVSHHEKINHFTIYLKTITCPFRNFIGKESSKGGGVGAVNNLVLPTSSVSINITGTSLMYKALFSILYTNEHCSKDLSYSKGLLFK